MVALVATLLLTWPVLRASNRLRNAEKIGSPPDEKVSHDNVVGSIFAPAATALRAPEWSFVDHLLTVVGFLLVVLATILKMLSHRL